MWNLQAVDGHGSLKLYFIPAAYRNRLMQEAQSPSRFSSSVDLERGGRQIDEPRLIYSDDRYAFVHLPIQIAVLKNRAAQPC
jgi:hypothetical protein